MCKFNCISCPYFKQEEIESLTGRKVIRYCHYYSQFPNLQGNK